MENRLSKKRPTSKGEEAENLVAEFFQRNGWKVDMNFNHVRLSPDLVVKKGEQYFVVEVKAVSEGRADRVLPLLSQAILQSAAYARENNGARPLAVVYVNYASPALVRQLDRFAKDFASDVAVGMVAEDGASYFHGGGLESLSADTKQANPQPLQLAPSAIDMFSDLNQWMLKVLLAPLIPDHLLTAPRPAGGLSNVSELASAADVSVMSAFRLVSVLKKEGFLDESAQKLELVRVAELFRRWRSAGVRSSADHPMCFLLGGKKQTQLKQIISEHNGCAGLFAAADALKLGLVSGVPPHVYHAKLFSSKFADWKELIPANPGEAPDLLLRQARAPQSLFRAAVSVQGIRVCDVIQIWLDVSVHPSRGREQANLIERRVFRTFIQGEI